MKKLILLSLIILVGNISCASNLYTELNRLERQIFRQTYEYDLPESRIERLETKIFGACQSGKLSDRYNLLREASKNYKAYTTYPKRQQVYNQYRPPIFTGSTGSSWRNILMGNFLNQFSGYPTGLTPAISQGMDPAYMDYFEAERAKNNGYYNERYYSTPHGYHSARTTRGTGTGVHILD